MTSPDISPDQGLRSDRPTAVPWPPLLLIALGAVCLVLRKHAPLPWPGLDDWPARVVGTGIGLAGIGLMMWSFATLQRHATTVMPHKGVDRLVTDGPYRWRRNPIYLGETMLLLGLAELSKNVWFVIAAAVFVALITWLQILPEERHLEARFGDEYREYKTRTRRWI